MSSPRDSITRGEARALLLEAGYAPTSLYAVYARLTPISGAGVKAVYRRDDVESAASAIRDRRKPKPTPKPRRHPDRVPAPPPPEATTLTWGQGLWLATEAGLSVGGAQGMLRRLVGFEDRPRDQPPTVPRAALDAEIRWSRERRGKLDAAARALSASEFQIRVAPTGDGGWSFVVADGDGSARGQCAADELAARIGGVVSMLARRCIVEAPE